MCFSAGRSQEWWSGVWRSGMHPSSNFSARTNHCVTRAGFLIYTTWCVVHAGDGNSGCAQRAAPFVDRGVCPSPQGCESAWRTHLLFTNPYHGPHELGSSHPTSKQKVGRGGVYYWTEREEVIVHTLRRTDQKWFTTVGEGFKKCVRRYLLFSKICEMEEKSKKDEAKIK